MAKKPKYEDILLMPNIIAETVCGREYTGREWSQNVVSPPEVKEIESKRKLLTQEEIREFADLCDARCKAAYEASANWFQKCIDAEGNAGRDDLYMWITHWMTSFIMTRDAFKRSCGLGHS